MQMGRGQKGARIGIRVIKTKGERGSGREKRYLSEFLERPLVPSGIRGQGVDASSISGVGTSVKCTDTGILREGARPDRGGYLGDRRLLAGVQAGEVPHRRGFSRTSSGSCPSAPFYSASRIRGEQCVLLSLPHAFPLRDTKTLAAPCLACPSLTELLLSTKLGAILHCLIVTVLLTQFIEALHFIPY